MVFSGAAKIMMLLSVEHIADGYTVQCARQQEVEHLSRL